MELGRLYEPITPPRISEKKLTRPLLKDYHPQSDQDRSRHAMVNSSLQMKEKELPSISEAPYTPPPSTIDSRSLIQSVQDESLHVGLVQFINVHNRAEVSYNAAVIDIRCENYHDLIRSLNEAARPQPGMRWGIARIDVLWELPVSMTTVESGNFRKTSLFGMQGSALRNILRLMNSRGWRDLFVVRYIEG